VFADPLGNEVLRIVRQFSQSCGSLRTSELAKLDQRWNSAAYGPLCIALLGEALNVPLDCVTEPSVPESINGAGKDKVTLQHDNLLSAHTAPKGIVGWNRKLCAHCQRSLSTISSLCSQSDT
jgi:hypothetical protein